MNTHYSIIKKSVILGLLCAITSITAFAESSAGYIVATGTHSTCIPTKYLWEKENPELAYPPITYHLQGMENECHLFHWYTSGDLRVDSISADSLTAYVSSVSTNPVAREKDYAKGRLYVTYEEENVSWICGDPVKYYDIYKTFKDTVPEIVGPDCINEGDTVTFSIEAMVSYNINSMIGIDRYYWDWSDGLVDSLMYYSGDSSSITFIAGPLTGLDTIFVDMGQCNLDDGFRYTKILGQAIEDPIFATGFEPSTCMPFGVTRDTIIISNPQDNVTYDWDLGSWKVDTTSLANSVIFYTNTNSNTITLTAINTCETKTFKYTISCCN